MVDLTPTITQAQIAFALAIIALAAVYYVFYKKPTRSAFWIFCDRRLIFHGYLIAPLSC